MIKIYCEMCQKDQPLLICKMTKDKINKIPWGDLLCKECNFVIATITVDEPGVYEFVKVKDIN